MATAQILIVEDERIIALELTRRLKQLGYAVVSLASSGPEAIHKAQALHPDLVLMDIGLKGTMTGIEAGEAIRTELQIPVVYVTAYAPENLLPPDQTTEPRLYVRKPFNEQQLRTTLERALAASPCGDS
jgi:two-component system, response regulator PdtaR